MKKTNQFVVSFTIGFLTALVLGITSVASAQPRIEPPADADGVCVATITRLSAGGITTEELAEIENVCVYQESMALDMLEGVMDTLNGPQGRPNFGTWQDAIAQLTSCRHIDEIICPNTGEELPPPPPRTRPRSRLIVECRGACAEDDAAAGISNGLRGRGWNRVAVCRHPAVPLTYSYRHAVVEGEAVERRHREDGVTLDIVYCYDPSSRTAPSVPPVDYPSAEPDLSAIWVVLNRHTAAIEIHSTRIRDLAEELAALAVRTDRLEDDAAADCGLTREEWLALTAEEVRRMHDEDECEDASTTVINNGWGIGFHLGVGLHLVGLTAPASITSPNGVVYAELEALPSEHAGFFLRGFIGAGDLMDRIGQYNPEGTIGFEGIAGGSAGLTIRINPMFAIDAGLASSFGFNPGGQIGSSLHAWPWFQIGGEARLRVNPLPWLHVEGTVGLDYAHSEVRRPNVPNFVGIDGVGYHIVLGVGVSLF